MTEVGLHGRCVSFIRAVSSLPLLATHPTKDIHLWSNCRWCTAPFFSVEAVGWRYGGFKEGASSGRRFDRALCEPYQYIAVPKRCRKQHYTCYALVATLEASSNHAPHGSIGDFSALQALLVAFEP